jgi:methylenetetrahydrofolate dehydrogenase (NADP+) / methenyltetrahydrofolate cyclohydrolase
MVKKPSFSEIEALMAELIPGKKIASDLCEEVARQVDVFTSEHGFPPALAVVLVGNDPASDIYVRRKIAECGKAGIRSIERRIPNDASETKLLSLIDELNQDKTIHGILVQLPLPAHIDASKVLDAIHPDKDVDGFHPVNVGRLSTGTGGLVPCTPMGCMMLLGSVVDEFRGLHAVVIGRSNIVGKPIALLLLEQGCTVSITHSATRDLPEIVRQADVVVAAAGVSGLVRGDWIKPGAVVIDVGISRVDGPDGKSTIVGDCVIDEMAHAAAVTPVPGGVGPMTIACLLSNTLKAARKFTDESSAH